MRAWLAPLAGLALLAGSLALGPAPTSGALPSLAGRLAGPFADLGAGLRSVRADAELARGRGLRAVAELERALALSPTRTDIWLQSIAAQGLQLSSAERVADARLRGRWIAGALETAERGLTACAEPEWVARMAVGVLRAQSASEPPPELPPGSPRLADLLATWTARLPESDR